MKKTVFIVILAVMLLIYGEATGILAPDSASALVAPNETTSPVPTVENVPETVEEIEYLNVESGTSKQLFVASNGLEVPYNLYIPENATPDMPVIFWLHGMGHLGKNLPEDYGAIHKANELHEERFIIVQPTAYYGWHVEKQFDAVLELVDFIVDEYKADSNRIILTGYSLGSLGAWYYAENATEYWAAVVPIANYCTTSLNAMYEADFSVWAICGEWDTYENRHGSEKTINKLAERNPYRDVRYTELKGCSHHDMAEAPFTPEFFDWAAAQLR